MILKVNLKKMYNQFFFFNSGTMRLIKDLIATVNPNIRENHLNIRNSVTRESVINPNIIPQLSFSSSDLPILHIRTLNANLPVYKEDRNGCMRRNSDTTVK